MVRYRLDNNNNVLFIVKFGSDKNDLNVYFTCCFMEIRGSGSLSNRCLLAFIRAMVLSGNPCHCVKDGFDWDCQASQYGVRDTQVQAFDFSWIGRNSEGKRLGGAEAVKFWRIRGMLVGLVRVGTDLYVKYEGGVTRLIYRSHLSRRKRILLRTGVKRPLKAIWGSLPQEVFFIFIITITLL